MARTLPNSRANPDKDRDVRYNRIVNRGEDLARQLKVDQVRNQPKQIHPNRARRNSPS